ncbi:MAG: TerC/Alx family metal homeostasis membrane protein [Actinobacteria bacterium]|nr:TerC/Alx family metal homeostasis membrane protein [Actinomycetota bacterium]
MDVSNLVWIVTISIILGLILVDLFTVSSKPHDVLFREASLWSIFYIAVAIAFGIWVFNNYGNQYGTEYFAAYLVEKSLSVDNIFVFAIILAQFAVPSIYHQRVLLIGVLLALVLRAIFIAIGAAALAAFSFTLIIFGAILIWTGIGLFKHWDEDPNPNENFIIRNVKKRIRTVEEYHGTKLFITKDGIRYATPMLIVMIAIASTDLLFALDSIPATFGVTQEPFLVFAVNAFALLGLRALYFLLKGLLDKLVYLSLGLSIILIFIGVKLVLTFVHEIYDWVPKIPTITSLAVIGGILFISTIASILKVRKDPTARAHAGRMTGDKEQPAEAKDK